MEISVTGIQVALNDNVAPTLSLKKETYIEGFDGWEMSNSSIYVDDEGILNLNKKGKAVSPFYKVNGEYWYVVEDFYTETETERSSPNGGGEIDSSYYDENYKRTLNNNNSNGNGYAESVELGGWKTFSPFNGYNSYSENIQNIKITVIVGDQYSQPPVKVRNFKIYGQLDNSFYDIFITKSDNESEIIKVKYAKGNQTEDYFINNGTEITQDSFRVYENGIYTVFVKDMAGNTTTQQIEITRIK